MKKLFNYLIATAVMALTFTSCEDVPSPFGDIIKPDNKEDVVIEPSGSGTEADPYNVAGVLEYISGLGADTQSANEVYIKGIVSDIQDIDVSGTYGNATYYISDDVDGKANKFMIYRGFGLGGKKFNEGATPVKLGDVLVIKSKVVNYKGNTPETVANNCIIVEQNGTKASGGGGGGDTETLGTKDNPLTIDQALEKINALGDGKESDQNAFVKGKVVKVTTNQTNFDKYGNLNYLISVDGTDNGKTITVYSGDGLDGAKFTGITDLAQGDEVIVFGKLYKFVKDSKVTPEIAKGNYLVSLVKGSGGGGGGDTETLGTKDAPLTIDKALELINALGDGKESDKNAYVKGKVVKVTTNQTNFEKYGNLNYLISEDGTDNGKTITVYSGDGLDGAKFTGITDLAQGDEVIVFGKLYKYVKDNKVTPEIAKGNYLVSLVKGSGGGGGGQGGATTLNVNFKADGQGNWTIANVKDLPSGIEFVWSYDNRYGMKASAFVNSTRYETDSWLVSPELNLANGGTLTFKQALNYATSEFVKVMYTTTSKSGAVNASDWQEASVDTWPAGNNWTFVTSNATLPAGTVRVAFRYTSTSSKAATWEIETVSIK